LADDLALPACGCDGMGSLSVIRVGSV